jgi:biopolymer transport protein ExbB
MTALFLHIAQNFDTLNKIIASAPVLPVQQAPEAVKMIDIIMKGGIIMIPIGLLSIIAVYVFIERYLTIRRHLSSDVEFMNSIHEYILNGRTDSALTLMQKYCKTYRQDD